MRQPLWTLALALCWCTLRADGARAGTITYTFESPQFADGELTPLPNIPPNFGPATFTTSFTDAVDLTGYQVTSHFLANGLMVGHALLELTATSALTLNFSEPVSQLSVEFALDSPFDNPFLRLITPSGTADQLGSNVGGAFPGGTLTFTAPVPFTSATLQGFNSGGASNTQIEVDNLSLTPAQTQSVPEPSTLSLFGVAASYMVACRLRRRKRQRAVFSRTT